MTLSFIIKNAGHRFSNGDGVALGRAVIPGGCMVAIMGLSGSGKSTLLNMLGGLLPPQTLGPDAVFKAYFPGPGGAPAELDVLSGGVKSRIADIGFVFQDAHLLRNATCRTNIAVALRQSKKRLAPHEFASFSRRLGLEAELSKRARQLSGGQKQRAAVGRGLIREPSILLADEPTANLDPRRGEQILGDIMRWRQEGGETRTVIWVTHNVHEAAIFADQLIILSGAGGGCGGLTEGGRWPAPNPHDPEIIRGWLYGDMRVPADPVRQRQALAKREIYMNGGLGRESAPAAAAASLGSAKPERVPVLSAIAFGDLFSSERIGWRPAPPFMARLIGETPVPPEPRKASPLIWAGRAGLAALGAAAGALALTGGAAIAALSDEAASLVHPAYFGLAAALLLAAALWPLLRAAGSNIAWAALAFGKWPQVFLVWLIFIFVLALGLGRDVTESTYIDALKSIDTSHFSVTSQRASITEAKVNEDECKLRSLLTEERALQSFFSFQWAEGARALFAGPGPDAASRLRTLQAECLAQIKARAAARLRVSADAALAAPETFSVYGRWPFLSASLTLPSGGGEAGYAASDCTPSQSASSPAAPAARTSGNVLAIRAKNGPEPVLGQMNFQGGAALRDMQPAVHPGAGAFQASGGGIPGVIIAASVLTEMGLKPADAVPTHLCLNIYRPELVRIGGIADAMPKEGFTAYKVMISHDYARELLHQDPLASSDPRKTIGYGTQAIYIAEPKLLNAYKQYFREASQKAGASATVLPDAFRQIEKGLESSYQLNKLAGWIILGVYGFAAVIVVMITNNFIRENEKSLCVMRAFGLRRASIAAVAAIQLMAIWLAAMMAGAATVYAAGAFVPQLIAGTLAIGAAGVATSLAAWPGVALILALITLAACLYSVMAWWAQTPWVGARLKEID